MPSRRPQLAAGFPRFWVPGVLLGAAAILALDPLPFRRPADSPHPVPDWATDTTPVRTPSLKPEYVSGVYRYRCSDCHRIIPTSKESPRPRTQHAEIDLQHGLNTHCLNCHHRTNRDVFSGHLEEEIPWGQPQLLCAKCHGPVYRDWQNGSHGRTNGFWDVARGPQTRRRCIECHDPHQPPFPSLQPAPAPHTLRMGPQLEAGHGAMPAELGPLRLGAQTVRDEAEHRSAGEGPGHGR